MTRLTVTTLLILATGMASLRAGVYESLPPASPLVQTKIATVVPLPFELFRDLMAQNMQKGIATPESPARREAIALRDKLKKLTSPTDMAILAAVQLRLREFDAALETLKLAEGRDPRNFWVMTHLAAYYQMTGQSGEAVRYQESCLDFFPTDAIPDQTTRDWLRATEKQLLKLFRLRARERSQAGGRARPPEDVDDLFGLKFVSEEGKYEADKQQRAAAQTPTSEQIATMQQLLLWFPDDSRLYWQLGELYNATGDVDSAVAIFNECVDARRLDAPKLREHRKVLLEFLEAKPKEPSWLPEGARLWVVAGLGGLAVLALVLLQFGQIVRKLRRSG